jgi:hypothetical protein
MGTPPMYLDRIEAPPTQTLDHGPEGVRRWALGAGASSMGELGDLPHLVRCFRSRMPCRSIWLLLQLKNCEMSLCRRVVSRRSRLLTHHRDKYIPATAPARRRARVGGGYAALPHKALCITDINNHVGFYSGWLYALFCTVLYCTSPP